MSLHCPRPHCGGRVWDEDGRLLCSLCARVYADPVTSGTVVLPPLSDDYVEAVRDRVLSEIAASPSREPLLAHPDANHVGRPRLLVCGRGHDDWKTDANGKRECRTCRRGYKHEYWRRAKGAG